MDCARASTRDPEEWIEQAPAFSRPLALPLRAWIMRWEPDLTESIKWNMLCFSSRKMICGLSACQRHLGLTFARGAELSDPAGLLPPAGNLSGILTIRFVSLDGLNRDALRALLHAAVALDAEPRLPPAPKTKREAWPTPDFFAAALAQRKHARAADFFQSLAPTYQREYLVWLTTAKRPETRAARLAQTIRALASGKKWIDRKRA